MSADHSYRAMLEFLDYASDHGLWKAATARSYAVAASKVEDELTEQEARDVRQIDLDMVFQRFVNRNKVGVAQKTLRTYKRRLGTAIQEFLAWREDPMNYRPQFGSRTRAPQKDAEKTKQSRPDRAAGGTEADVPVRSAPAPSGLLNIPFPLRPDFVVSVQVPPDLKLREADRLAAFIRTLAADYGE